MPADRAHLRTLDGVRGLAIILVMLWHMTVIDTTTPTGQAIYRFTSFGWSGVDLFFVLSGALITGILLDTRGRDGFFRNFYVRRTLRIWPLYYAILIFSFYLLPHLPAVPIRKLANFSRIAPVQGWYWLFLQNYSIAAAGTYRHGIMDVTWSLAIEEQFYLVWPLLVSLISRRRTLAWILVGLIAASFGLRIALTLAGWNRIAIYVMAPTRLDGLCVGGLIALALRSPLGPQLLRWGARLGLPLGGAAILALALWRGLFVVDDIYVEMFGFLALAGFFGGFVAAAILANGTGSFLDRLLSGRVLGAFGLYSYAMYLVHLPLRAVVRDRLLRPETFDAFPGGPIVAQLVFFAVSIALSFAVAAASYHLFEKRFLRLKDVIAAPRRRQPLPMDSSIAEPEVST